LLASVTVSDRIEPLSPTEPGAARQLAWDYTRLAEAYLTRPDYSGSAIDRILDITGLTTGTRAIDLGAGAGHLTLRLAERGWDVLAMEPNPAMRERGIGRTATFANVQWIDGVMEQTGQPDAAFLACTYGSSFGVVDRLSALREAARLLDDRGWFVCVFNHRDLDDPLQREIEAFIASRLPGYDYGVRREDQTPVIASSRLFGPVVQFDTPITHVRPVEEWLEAWRSHATLQRQAGDAFPAMVDGIGDIVRSRGEVVAVPYLTRVWLAPRLPRTAPARATS